ncbi:HEAT repeat domain-containing protein [Solwaraspora sp. WMMD937]|uniref:HEAT repeat domain-containing protein n=1 Tax=Solwaraspora sp. WMMD937 TaxID=3016090 RepID=UPI00249ABA08|nr:HEAT repeat domain-containing protein [Solwaraspora sp. WMMD937]WFE22540.1 HEAT repeat domain-containing protein [Solwaraspora sp. WMMD937]
MDVGVGWWVRVEAVRALAVGGSLTPVVVEALTSLVMDAGVDPSVRAGAVDALRQASPTEDVIARLVSLFADEEQRLRAAAGRTLIALARRHSASADSIVATLAAVCSQFSGHDQDTKDRPGVDEAYHALRSLVGDPAPALP